MCLTDLFGHRPWRRSFKIDSSLYREIHMAVVFSCVSFDSSDELGWRTRWTRGGNVDMDWTKTSYMYWDAHQVPDRVRSRWRRTAVKIFPNIFVSRFFYFFNFSVRVLTGICGMCMWFFDRISAVDMYSSSFTDRTRTGQKRIFICHWNEEKSDKRNEEKAPKLKTSNTRFSCGYSSYSLK